MNRNIVYVVIVIAAITVLLFAGKGMSHRPEGRLRAGNSTGQIAPDFELKVLGGNGKTMKLSELKGKAVLLDFWATYCEPCKFEMPWIAELQKEYGPQGFQVVGIVMDADVGENTVSSFAQKMGVNYPILLGTADTVELYGGDRGLPMNFFIDRSGKVAAFELGLIEKEKAAFRKVYEANIKKALGETTAP